MSTPASPPFGELLRRARRAAGLTQEELAERSGISVDAISLLERGLTRAPQLDTLERLSEALQLEAPERAAWEHTTRGLRLPSEETAPVLEDERGPLPPRDLPTGTVTFLFTDIEGSTRLLQRLGPAYALALGEHQARLRAAFAAHGGREVDTQGDAFFVAFATAPDAVMAAAEATGALAEHAWPEGAILRVRMGLHTGTPQVVGEHYVGLDVHRAARIASAGHGGQVLLSQATRELVEYSLPQGMTLRELGAHRLKDLQQPERLYQLLLPGLPSDFPPLKTLDTHQHNLPVQPTPILGREAQVGALAALLRGEEGRLVTLIGPGGIGKTRLAVQVAAELVDTFADGVWFVRLARLVDPGLVLPTIAQTLGLKERGSEPLAETLHAYVSEKRLLLVLDNFEQVVRAAPEVATLLEASPGLHVLVTSRVPLHLRGERESPLVPLPLPDHANLPPPEALSQYAAVALFIERAQAAWPDFAVTAANAPVIAEICARLDGLPLALELAAARVKVLPPEALLARLSRGLQLLSGGARDADERQQTMRATIAWSEDLLTPEERVLLRRLAVFVGGGTFEAAEAICTAPEGLAPLGLDLLEGLTALVDNNLVHQREESGEPRFGMLQVIREYALERLEASGEAEALRRAHTAYMVALGERAESKLRGPEGGAWLAQLERELDNLRAALGWARERGEAETGLRLAVAVRGFWDARGHLQEGRTWVEGLLALASGVADGAEATTLAVAIGVRVRALLAAGGLALWQGDAAGAAPWLEEAVAVGQAAGDLLTAARALRELGIIAEQQGDLEQAGARYAASLTLMRETGQRRGIATTLNDLGVLAVSQGDLERGAASFEEALALYRQDGDRRGVALCLQNLGGVAQRRGEVVQAEALGREGLALLWDLGNLRACTEGLELLASTAGAAGQGERAARLLGAASALRETLGAPQPPQEQVEVEQAVAAARAALGEEAWAAAYAAGRALSREQAIAEALIETDGG
jgi:predicted ATPase/class 3 adenylate cyclase